MPKLTLRLGDVAIELVLQSHDVAAADQPYLDWLHCRLTVVDGGFTGVVAWDVMPMELKELAEDLLRLYDAFPRGETMDFKPTEPNLVIRLLVGKRGQVEGSYEVFDELVNGTSMQGNFVIEQAALPALAADIRRFIADASRHTA